MKQLVIRCDLCDTDAAYANVEVAIGDVLPRQLDLCDHHFDTLVAPLLAALSTFGVNPEAPPRRPRDVAPPETNRHRVAGPFRCQVPDCASAPLKHRSTLNAHVVRLHDMTWEAYLDAYGPLVPLDPDAAVDVVEAVCELCGKVYSNALGHRWPQSALRTHMRGSHGMRMRHGRLTSAFE